MFFLLLPFVYRFVLFLKKVLGNTVLPPPTNRAIFVGRNLICGRNFNMPDTSPSGSHLFIQLPTHLCQQFFKARPSSLLSGRHSIHLIWPGLAWPGLAYANRQQPLEQPNPFNARQQFTLPLPSRFVYIQFTLLRSLLPPLPQTYGGQWGRTIKGNRNYTDWKVVTMRDLAIKFKIPQTRLVQMKLILAQAVLWL